MPTRELLYTFGGQWECPPVVYCIGKGQVRLSGRCGRSPVRGGPIPTGLCMVTLPKEDGSAEREMAFYMYGGGDEVSIVHVK
jgi:hypothetical protein